MSAETPSWNTGAAHASVRRRAIVLRMEVSWIYLDLTGGGTGDRPRCAATRRRAFSTSSATIRPSGPVPGAW